MFYEHDRACIYSMYQYILPWSSIAKCRFVVLRLKDFHELSLTVTTKPSWSPARLDFSLRPTVACPNHWAVNYGTWRKMPDLEAVDVGLSESNVMYIRILYLEWCLTFFDHIPPLRVYGIPLYTQFFRHIHMITIRVPLLKGGLLHSWPANRISHQSSSSTNCFMRHSASAARSASDMSIFSDLAAEG